MATTIIQPYLSFNGCCEEAVEFYRTALGAETLMLMRYKDSPEPPAPNMLPPDFENKIMHVSLRIGGSVVMASDSPCQSKEGFHGFSLSLSVPDEAEAEKVFAALAEGGQIHMPLEKTFWSPRFGMLADKFGVRWMVDVGTSE